MKGCARSLAIAFLFVGRVDADDQPRVRVETDVHLSRANEARQLVDAVADACNAGDSRTFLRHFTTRYGASIRSKIRERFASEDPTMRVLEVTVDSSTEKTMKFEARYLWEDSSGASVITADVLAKREGGQWKIDGEKVIGRKSMVNRDTAFQPVAAVQNRVLLDPDSPADIPQIRGSCQNGQCRVE